MLCHLLSVRNSFHSGGLDIVRNESDVGFDDHELTTYTVSCYRLQRTRKRAVYDSCTAASAASSRDTPSRHTLSPCAQKVPHPEKYNLASNAGTAFGRVLTQTPLTCLYW